MTKVAEVNAGPLYTQYALRVAIGTTMQQITQLSNELAIALASPGKILIDAPIAGRDLVGINLPNRNPEYVSLKRMFQSDIFRKSTDKLSVVLGLDMSGSPVISSLASNPYTVIAGAAGSGKTMLLHSWILSLLYKSTPKEVRLILIDAKGMEFHVYNGIPHLLTPVITEPENVISSLKAVVEKIANRCKKFTDEGVTNIESFNKHAGHHAMPYIVICIDDFGSLMKFSKEIIEDTLFTITQKGRLAGVYLVTTVQRPSVDLTNKLMKVHIPTRISFALPSDIESQAIINTPGAEDLQGNGDMLVVTENQQEPVRVQGAYVSEKEIQSVVSFFKKKNPLINKEKKEK